MVFPLFYEVFEFVFLAFCLFLFCFIFNKVFTNESILWSYLKIGKGGTKSLKKDKKNLDLW